MRLSVVYVHVSILCDTKQHKGKTPRVVALQQAISAGADESGGSVNREATNLIHDQIRNKYVLATRADADGTYTENRPMSEHKVILGRQKQMHGWRFPDASLCLCLCLCRQRQSVCIILYLCFSVSLLSLCLCIGLSLSICVFHWQ